MLYYVDWLHIKILIVMDEWGDYFLENEELLKRLPEDENEEQYLWRISGLIESGKLPQWRFINEQVNKALGIPEEEMRDESSFRKRVQAAKKFYYNVFSKKEKDGFVGELEEARRELEKEKVKFRDERNAWVKQNRDQARIEEDITKLGEMLSKMSCDMADDVGVCRINNEADSGTDMIVILSDLHIGQTFNNYFGKYDSDIAKERLDEYLNKACSIGKNNNVRDVYVVCVGDLISGNIHKTVQVADRENVIKQVKLASEYVSNFCMELCREFSNVKFVNVSGNHSRIDNYKDAIHDERLDDLIGFIVKNIMNGFKNFEYIENFIDNGIACIDIRGKNYVAVHGDYDKLSNDGIARLSMMIGFVPYSVIYGHLHHNEFSSLSNVKLIRGGSLSSTGDQFTVEKRIKGEPSQMICLVDNSGIKSLHPIVFK